MFIFSSNLALDLFIYNLKDAKFFVFLYESNNKRKLFSYVVTKLFHLNLFLQ
jgi:hypothetical protein